MNLEWRYEMIESSSTLNGAIAFKLCKCYYLNGEIQCFTPVHNLFNQPFIDLTSLNVVFIKDLPKRLQHYKVQLS